MSYRAFGVKLGGGGGGLLPQLPACLAFRPTRQEGAGHRKNIQGRRVNPLLTSETGCVCVTFGDLRNS